MTKAICLLCLLLGALLQSASAVPLTSEQKDVTAFIKKMYSYSSNMFELGEFNKKVDPGKQCALVEIFFLKELITHPQMSKRCLVGGIYIRHPGLVDEEFEKYEDPTKGARYKVSVPDIEGDKASVAVTSQFGRTVFFLTRTGKGLRVENALFYQYWPTSNETCSSNFLLPPNGWQKKAEQPVCNK